MPAGHDFFNPKVLKTAKSLTNCYHSTRVRGSIMADSMQCRRIIPLYVRFSFTILYCNFYLARKISFQDDNVPDFREVL